MQDPNFPPDLDIRPSANLSNGEDLWEQSAAISTYGIAGRVWEATGPLIAYLSPRSPFDPPCSLFNDARHRVLELGAGQSLPSLHLASFLSPDNIIILTDLPNVLPLCEKSVNSWQSRTTGSHAQVIVRPLAWGEDDAQIACLKPLTHILMCDLIYFPDLYPPLLRTLLQLTEPADGKISGDDVFGPQIILSYKSRTLELEMPFFDSFNHYFAMTPVVGEVGDARIFLCRRWRTTERWMIPDLKDIMKGSREVIIGRDYSFVDHLLGSIEW